MPAFLRAFLASSVKDLAGLVRIHDLLDLGPFVPALGHGKDAVARLEDAAGDLAALLAHQPGRHGATHLGSRRFLSSSVYSRRSSVMRVKADGEIELTVTP